ncbi:MAG TPA: SoxR reducing system RseC family protein [Candidatus Brocadiia bacterium]|nr:SoxR reducing system RseC family protein [Candidatus Brocadiia bacterium]
MSQTVLRCGVIKSKNARSVTVRLDAAGKGQSCSSCACGCAQGLRPVDVVVPAEPDALSSLNPGDSVQVSLVLPNPAWAAVALFLAPALLLVGGVAVFAPGGELRALAIAAGITALWYAAVAVFDRAARRAPSRRPRIAQVPGRAGAPPLTTP